MSNTPSRAFTPRPPHGGSSEVQGLELMTHRSRVRDHNHGVTTSIKISPNAVINIIILLDHTLSTRSLTVHIKINLSQNINFDVRCGFSEKLLFAVVSYRVLKTEVNKEKIRYMLQFFFDNGENASQVAEIVNGVYGVDTVTAN
ncbi:hypothetical protein TNCV_4242261 [Trichonephila clavipes]|nr:hypothetical protein TNCV_4242261 [Trichonephila clavipes]